MPDNTQSNGVPESIATWAIRGLPSTNFPTKVVVFIVVGMCLTALWLAIVVELPEIRTVRGEVRTQGLIADIKAPQSGTVRSILVSRDEAVVKDQPLMIIGTDVAREAAGDSDEIEQARLDRRIIQLENERKDLNEKRSFGEKGHVLVIAQLEKQVVIQSQLLDLMVAEIALFEKKFNRAKSLERRNISTKDQIETVELHLNEALQKRTQAQLSLLRLKHNIEDQHQQYLLEKTAVDLERSKIETQIEVLLLEAQELKRSRKVTILSPFSGFVAHIETQQGSSVVGNGSPVIQISENRPGIGGFFAKFVVESRSLRNVAVGQSTRIELDTFSVAEWGTFPAFITNISETSLPDNTPQSVGDSSESYFLIQAVFDSEPTFDREIYPHLRDGLKVTGFVAVDQRPLISWIIEPLQRISEILL